MNSRNQVLASIELRWPEAVWVLTAHAYATLVPLALCVAVFNHWDFLVATTYNPFLFYIAAGLLCAGSAFEVAQNAFDRWYLTADAPSANGAGFSDFLFYWLVTAGQGLCAVAIAGDHWWVQAIAIAMVAVFPFCYLLQFAHFAPLTVASTLSICMAFVAFGDPTVFLQLVLAGVTMYFFSALLKTGAQFIHGFTTMAASSGVWFFIWALNNAASASLNSWLTVLTITAAVAAAAAVLWPVLLRFPASKRVVREATA
jgi:hypothetical protein